MCVPKAPKIQQVAPPAPPPVAVQPEAPEVGFKEDNSPAGLRRKGRQTLRTDKSTKAGGVQLPKMKSVI